MIFMCIYVHAFFFFQNILVFFQHVFCILEESFVLQMLTFQSKKTVFCFLTQYFYTVCISVQRFCFLTASRTLKYIFQKLKIEMQLYQDLANILKLVMHLNNSSKFSYRYQPPNTLSLRKEKGSISKTPCIQAFKHSTIHFLLSPHTVNLDLSPKRCQN